MRRLSLFATVAGLAATSSLAGDAAAQTTCDPSRVMVLFDRSYSMVAGSIDGATKWSLATNALRGVVGDYETKAEFGLSVFPESDGTCTSGAKVVTGPALNSLTDIDAKLTAETPNGNEWTPLGQAVKEMANVAALKDTTKRRYVIVVSDGAQSCPAGERPGQVWGTQTIVNHVNTLRQMGVKVFVVGFGKQSMGGSADDGVDSYTLNQMAWAGGTAIRGCDPAAPALAGKLCYYQADTGEELSAAFEEILVQTTEEECDGKDNNCNGLIDEDLSQGCQTACGDGTQVCVDGAWGMCSATQPQDEICDGVDNNCDGVVDEGCECLNDDVRPCGRDTGECELGEQKCVNGQWGPCEGGKGPTEEICDGLDNNCDGFIDPDCDCLNGEQRPCGGPDIGQCRSGIQHCVTGGWGPCEGAVGPGPEVCDGIDNDCDGLIDEGGAFDDDDDLFGHLCRADEICQNGMCISAPMIDPPGGVTPGQAAGCACRAADASSQGTSPLGGLLLAAVLGGLLLARRRR